MLFPRQTVRRTNYHVAPAGNEIRSLPRVQAGRLALVSRREFELDGVVPWGRTAAEYEKFFALDGLPGDAAILDCGGGPSSFSSEYARRGYRTVCVDPLFRWPVSTLRERFDATVEPMMTGMRRARDRFVWSYYSSPEHVLTLREQAVEMTLAELSADTRSTAFVSGALPALPFIDDAFDLALCSHLLFLYSDELSLPFHEAAIDELMRVAREVQVFPLLDMAGCESVHLSPLRAALERRYAVDIEQIEFEFQRGGNRRLRVSRR